MQPIQPIHTVDLFPVLHNHLIDLLKSLSPADWQRPTVCTGWSVKDITAHLLDGHLRRITLYRDNYVPDDGPRIDSYQTLVRYLNQLNHDWVMAMRRVSPALLIEWLEETGPQTYELFRALPPDEDARFSVAWAGEDRSPNWFHIAREYTELWHHQQQIRLAVGKTEPLMTAVLYHPLLDTFVRALPHTYRDVTAPDGTLIALIISGDGGGRWCLARNGGTWTLHTGAEPTRPAVSVRIDGHVAWRLFTKSLTPTEWADYVTVEGDQRLGTPVLGMVSVMA